MSLQQAPAHSQHRSAVLTFVSLLISIGDTDRMALSEWTQIFENEARGLLRGDPWELRFDSTIQEGPDYGWQQYIRSTSARSVSWGTWLQNNLFIFDYLLFTCFLLSQYVQKVDGNENN